MNLDDMEWGFRAESRRRRAGAGTLPLTSMMDMLTIILIFLLLNLAPDYAINKVADNLDLPGAPKNVDAVGKIRISISRTALELDDTVIAAVVDGTIEAGGLESLETAIAELFNPDDEAPEPVVVLADRTLNYETVDAVLKAAGRAGFPDFRFAIVDQGA